uniref:Cyclin-like domain-containing protein n=1 Tax=Fibrocapsa japonica TaxID=94617 RepID=A0A7S2V468_9STRA|mmetsp:Transcript_24041/g.34924  ORF Transcript_24041/g.34924 Transcript_24041/m.34924 type:complete len:309 (+) Transcript_24041:99-1025(+)
MAQQLFHGLASQARRHLDANSSSTKRTRKVQEVYGPFQGCCVGKRSKNVDHRVESSCSYGPDTLDFLLSVELSRDKHPLSSQSNLNALMRMLLVDWIIRVQHKGLANTSLHLAVSIIDRYCESSSPICQSKFQLVGIAAIRLAAKYEQHCHPSLKDSIDLSGNQFTSDEIINMEFKIFDSLKGRFSLPTSFLFLHILLPKEAPCHVWKRANYLIDLALMSLELQCFEPSMVAQAVIQLAYCTFRSTLPHIQGRTGPYLQVLKVLIDLLRAGPSKTYSGQVLDAAEEKHNLSWLCIFPPFVFVGYVFYP